MSNVQLKEGFTQVCVWPGTPLGDTTPAEFEAAMPEMFGGRVQFLEEIVTAPDLTKTGRPKKGTGGRNDLLFAVHSEDIGKFALRRLQAGIRWIEDVYGNGGGHLYPERVAAYKSW